MKNPLSQTAREVVWGCLFGDGSLVKLKPFKQMGKGGQMRICKYRHYRLQIRHSSKQREYAEWLYSYLFPLCPGLREYKFADKRNGKIRFVIDLVTRTHSYFSRLRKYFYPKGKKAIKRKLLNKLTPLGLAVWFMDGGTGSFKRNRVWLSANCFSLEEQKIIQDYFREKWNIKTSIVKERNQYKISFNSDSKKFCQLIESYVLPSMRYKLII